MSAPPFSAFPKIARYSREVVVTEKIDGTNGVIHVDDTMAELYAGSRSQWLGPDGDNFGFGKWLLVLIDRLLEHPLCGRVEDDDPKGKK